MSITLDLTSIIRRPPMLPVDLIGASKGLYLIGASKGSYLIGASKGSYLIGASKGLYLWVNPSEAPRLAPVHLRHVANPHFYTYAQLPHHTCQRSSTTHNCRERKRRATLEAMVILMPSGCLSAAYFWFYVSKPSTLILNLEHNAKGHIMTYHSFKVRKIEGIRSSTQLWYISYNTRTIVESDVFCLNYYYTCKQKLCMKNIFEIFQFFENRERDWSPLCWLYLYWYTRACVFLAHLTKSPTPFDVFVTHAESLVTEVSNESICNVARNISHFGALPRR